MPLPVPEREAAENLCLILWRFAGCKPGSASAGSLEVIELARTLGARGLSDSNSIARASVKARNGSWVELTRAGSAGRKADYRVNDETKKHAIIAAERLGTTLNTENAHMATSKATEPRDPARPLPDAILNREWPKPVDVKPVIEPIVAAAPAPTTVKPVVPPVDLPRLSFRDELLQLLADADDAPNLRARNAELESAMTGIPPEQAHDIGRAATFISNIVDTAVGGGGMEAFAAKQLLEQYVGGVEEAGRLAHRLCAMAGKG